MGQGACFLPPLQFSCSFLSAVGGHLSPLPAGFLPGGTEGHDDSSFPSLASQSGLSGPG